MNKICCFHKVFFNGNNFVSNSLPLHIKITRLISNTTQLVKWIFSTDVGLL
jgi:hypothetical protein